MSNRWENDFLLRYFGSRFGNVRGIIADSFKFREALDIVIQKVAVCTFRNMRGKMNHIIVNFVRQHINIIFVFIDFVDGLFIIMPNGSDWNLYSGNGKRSHFWNDAADAGKCKHRRCKKLFVKLLNFSINVLFRIFIIFDNKFCKFFKLQRNGKKNDCSK